MTSITIIQAALEKKWDFRYNLVKCRVEFRSKGEPNYKPLTDYEQNSILVQLNTSGIQCSNSNLGDLLLSEFSKAYDPLDVYFKGLPEWDGVTDHIGQLCDTVKTTNDLLWRKLLKKWLIGLAGAATDENTVNQTMIILYSSQQGLGKSKWIEKLIPSVLKEYCYAGNLNLNNKDTVTSLAQNFMIILDEMTNFKKDEVAGLKEIITKSIINIRLPYGHNFNYLPRRASFIGSTNESRFLQDSTGSRRFMPFEAIDINYSHGINIDKVYGQAYTLFKRGFNYWLDKDEINELEKNNEVFQELSSEEELLIKYFRNTQERSSIFFTATDIVSYVASKEPHLTHKISPRSMGRALAKKKYKRVKKNGVYGYFVAYRNGKEGNLGNLNVSENLNIIHEN